MRRVAALLATLCLAASTAEAAQTASQPARKPANMGLDSNAPIAVNADSFLADLNGETGTYTGNVIVTQGAVRLHADQVKVTAPGGRASKMEAQGHVIVDSPSGQAVGDNGIYDVPSQILHLNGHVVLTKEANVMRGSTLEVAMATGIARLTAGAEPAPAGQTPAQTPPGRVQGLFFPAQKTGAAAPAANANPPANTPKP
jgi:lipopolysaccharide export system protein LptA